MMSIHFVVFLPLLGAALAGFFGKQLNVRGTHVVTVSLMGLSAVFAWDTFFQITMGEMLPSVYPLISWITVGELDVSWALKLDPLSAVMMVVVSSISALVHLYSVSYMKGDQSQQRFMAYLSLFTFMMLMLVTADNMLQLFFGWEGVGVCSYLLIGFWFKKESANQAAMKAFLVNRVADVAFVLGLGALFFVFQTLSIDDINHRAIDVAQRHVMAFGFEWPVLELIGVLLFIGAMGKSAQIFLHTWLPDAMEGPTPVSALIHAATMVTAGVFLVVRLSPVYDLAPFASQMITYVGATTALFAGTVALTQNDIKRVVAYSTCSQLGYMFFAVGVGAYGAAIFHLFTHAFFKALLFLGAGSVIHGLSHEQDMRRMGGLWRKMPFTYAMMWIGSLALSGVPIFAGYYSKDAILEAAWMFGGNSGFYAYGLGVAAAALTAFYSWRLLFLTFHGAPRSEERVMDRVHEAPLPMAIPLALLAFGAIFSGILGHDLFLSQGQSFWKGSLFVRLEDTLLHPPLWVIGLPLLLGVIGIGIAFLFYKRKPELPGRLAAFFPAVYRFFLNKWYFDELYRKLFVETMPKAGRFLWRRGDMGTIDRWGPDGISNVALEASNRTSRLQSGYVYHYALAMVFGVAVFALFLILYRSSWFAGGLAGA
ncbi:MAG: NADH-quinone oxidoreductase subunit L [bacterium]|nr:NADH-quinone oxidoreductase subunit L [bacterium]